MKIRQGYVLQQRDIIDTLWEGERHKFSRAEAWMDLLMAARFESEPIEIPLSHNGFILCERGQYVVSLSDLAKRWQWSVSSVRRMLDRLSNMNAIRWEASSRLVRITICNYGTYEGGWRESDEKLARSWREK
jgi:DNA-binding MarR family transcriptional regulator